MEHLIFLVAVICGMGLGWWFRGGEVSLLKIELSSLKEEFHRVWTSSWAERERLVHHLVSMRKAGFVPTEGEEVLESWVLTDEHEAEVQAARRGERNDDDPITRGVMEAVRSPAPLP